MFFCNDTATTEIYTYLHTLSRHDALPITISTRVRVNTYTNIRPIAETSDGKLHLAVAPVKASGGCSAPASGDQELALSRMGKMSLKQLGSWRQNALAEAKRSEERRVGKECVRTCRHWVST